MLKRMVPHNVTFLVDLFDNFGILPGFYPYGKESDLDPVASQDLKEIWGSRRVWPIIKSQGDTLCALITPAKGLDEEIKF